MNVLMDVEILKKLRSSWEIRERGEACFYKKGFPRMDIGFLEEFTVLKKDV